MEVEGLQRLKNLISELRQELQMSRIRIQILEPKAEAYDALIKVLGMVRGGDSAMARDIMWDVERAQEDLDGAIRAAIEQAGIDAAKRAAAAEADKEPAHLRGTETGPIEEQVAHPERFYPSGVRRAVPLTPPADGKE